MSHENSGHHPRVRISPSVMGAGIPRKGFWFLLGKVLRPLVVILFLAVAIYIAWMLYVHNL